MRATVEFHGEESTLPKIKVVIADSSENEGKKKKKKNFFSDFYSSKMFVSK